MVFENLSNARREKRQIKKKKTMTDRYKIEAYLFYTVNLYCRGHVVSQRFPEMT